MGAGEASKIVKSAMEGSPKLCYLELKLFIRKKKERGHPHLEIPRWPPFWGSDWDHGTTGVQISFVQVKEECISSRQHIPTQ